MRRHGAAMAFDQLLDEREPDAGAADVAGLVFALEASEQPRCQLVGDAITGVEHREAQMLGGDRELDLDRSG
jgi:hypothetical protein